MAKKKAIRVIAQGTPGIRTTVAPAIQDMASTVVPPVADEHPTGKEAARKAGKKRRAVRVPAAKATKVGRKTGAVKVVAKPAAKAVRKPVTKAGKKKAAKKGIRRG